jgi:competence protein ComEA
VCKSEYPTSIDLVAPAEPSGSPEGGGRPGRRLLELWHRVRGGEDPIAFGAVVVVALVAGGLWFWAGSRPGGVPAASAAPAQAATDGPAGRGEASTDATTTTATALAVHVAGAVARPGLYRLPAGSRVADALSIAGGKLPAADTDRLNLAARLVDGQKILVTRRGEAPADPIETAPGVAAGAGVGAGVQVPGNPPDPIDLNAADLATLDSLPGVGPATARAILEERARRGGFRSGRDLLRVPGIGEGRFARLKDRIRV